MFLSYKYENSHRKKRVNKRFLLRKFSLHIFTAATMVNCLCYGISKYAYVVHNAYVITSLRTISLVSSYCLNVEDTLDLYQKCHMLRKRCLMCLVNIFVVNRH